MELEYTDIKAAIEGWLIKEVVDSDTVGELVLVLERFKGGFETKRVQLDFTELGMWIEKEELL